MRSKRSTVFAALAALSSATPALAADWFVGVGAGPGSADETGTFGVQVPGFAGPTVDHDICGGTATITVGAEPTVTHMSGTSANYRIFVGARVGAWAFELGKFNAARIEGQADTGPYGVVQPTCNPVPTDPITVDAFGRKVESLAFSGWTFSPIWSYGFAPDWSLDLRANLAFWDREQRSEWQVMVTENVGGTPIQTYPTEWSYAEGGGSDVDLGVGIGVSWQLQEGARVRLQYEHQPYGDFTVSAFSLGIAIDVGD